MRAREDRASPTRCGVRRGGTVRGVALKNVMRRLTASVEELDREALTDFCDRLDVTPTDQIVPRRPIRVGGEVRSVRLVPRAGAPALEITISDGHSTATAVFLGRRTIAGLTPGRRVILEGVPTPSGNRFLIFNPLYTLLP
jgi:hypothetical protein